MSAVVRTKRQTVNNRSRVHDSVNSSRLRSYCVEQHQSIPQRSLRIALGETWAVGM